MSETTILDLFAPNDDRSEPLLIRPAEAALLLSVSRSRVYELIREGEIPAIRLGGTLRVPVAKLHELVANRTSGGAA